jgi:large subunit ribosomal protein L31
MRPDIHPEWFAAARVHCSCGNSFTVGATVPEIRTDVCSACHPLYTGEQRIVDTAGQVDRFMRRLEAGHEQRQAAVERVEALRRAQVEARRKRRGLATGRPGRERTPARQPNQADE